MTIQVHSSQNFAKTQIRRNTHKINYINRVKLMKNNENTSSRSSSRSKLNIQIKVTDSNKKLFPKRLISRTLSK